VALTLAQALEAGPVVLDGGLATQLEADGHDLRDELWSARLLRDSPEAVVAAHRAFLAAGARVLTTASYQATVDGFVRHGVRPTEARRLLQSSVALARRACAELPDAGPLWIAASVGPYGAALADGSEYRGNYGRSHAELVRFHRPRMAMLAECEPDVLALETVPDVREAQAMLDALDGLGVPAWLSYTIDAEHTRAGQPLVEAFSLVAGRSDIVAVGVNCSSPVDSSAAVAVAAAASGLPVVVYPNRGERWDARARAWVGPATEAATLGAGWVRDGARLVGGCCRVTPADIAVLAREVAAHA
jgi:homocysteine S-methyltransferase